MYEKGRYGIQDMKHVNIRNKFEFIINILIKVQLYFA